MALFFESLARGQLDFCSHILLFPLTFEFSGRQKAQLFDGPLE